MRDLFAAAEKDLFKIFRAVELNPTFSIKLWLLKALANPSLPMHGICLVQQAGTST